MSAQSVISLIVPTRQRPARLRQHLASLGDTTARPELLEVILVIDGDDPESGRVGDPRLTLRRVVVPPGRTMGSLNMAGYEASRGRYVMLLNDDVIAQTSGWDDAVRSCFEAYPDEILLVHVNDRVFGTNLCTFPIVSRTFCELAGGICPRDYVRYRIDDHIEDCFNLLGLLGERRIIYAPDIVFEHVNYVENANGLRQYFSDPAILAVDAPRFDALTLERKWIALQMKAHISGETAIAERWQRRLDAAPPSLELRVADRQRILTEQGIVDPWDLRPSWWRRGLGCLRNRGWRGAAKAVGRRLAGAALRER